MSLTTPASRRVARPRATELVFLGLGATVFTVAVSAAASYCVACVAPAIVSSVG